jgi:predicted ester cyclase
VQGLSAVKQFTAGFHQSLSDMYLTVRELIAEGDRVAARWTAGGRHTGPLYGPGGAIPPTGKDIAMEGMSILRVRDGRITEERTQADVLGMMRQLGVAP